MKLSNVKLTNLLKLSGSLTSFDLERSKDVASLMCGCSTIDSGRLCTRLMHTMKLSNVKLTNLLKLSGSLTSFDLERSKDVASLMCGCSTIDSGRLCTCLMHAMKLSNVKLTNLLKPSGNAVISHSLRST